MSNQKYPFLARVSLKIARRINRKRTVNGLIPSEPCVFLCRHRDMKGVAWAFVDINKVIRPWVLDCFCSYKDAKSHLKNYTFSKRMKKGKAFCFLFAPAVARVITSYVKSLRSIPVYRNEKASKSISTIKQTVTVTTHTL